MNAPGRTLVWCIALVAALLAAACNRNDPAQLIRSARDYQAKGEHQAAVIQLKNAVQKQPDNGEARLLLARSSLAVGDPLSAEKEFRKALEFGQSKDVVAPLLAQALLEGGEVDKVVSEFGSQRLGDPKADAELRARVGEAQVRMRRLPDAATSFQQALAADPANVRAALGTARLMAIDGKLPAALAAVGTVVAAQPASSEALMLQAELQLAADDHAAARASLEKAVAADPVAAAPRFELIALLISDNDLDAASRQIEAARAVRGGDLRLQYFDALVAVGRKDYPRARELAQQLLKKAPEHVPTLVLAGGVELQEKQYGSAESYLQKALTLAPQHRGARALLARNYLANNQPSRAVDTLQPLVARGARIDAPTMMLAGEAYLASGDIKQAAVFFEAAAKSKPQEALARMRLGQIAMASGDLDGGIRVLEEATAQGGAPIQAELALIAGYVRQGNSAKALQAAQDLVKRQPSAMAYQILASVYLTRNDRPAARTAFGKALEIDPVFLPATAGLAQLDLADNKPAEARARFEALAAKEPKNELPLLGLAEVMAATRTPLAEILPVLQRAVAARPDSTVARVALVNLLLQKGDTRAALTAAQEASAAIGNDPRILEALGRAQLAAGEGNQAIETFNRLVAAEPQSTAPLLRLAAVHTQRQELDKAVEVLQRAQRLAPGDPNVGRDLVLGYLMQGKVDEALKQARALQASAPKSAAGYLLEGDVYGATKQWAPAERAYREGLKADPNGELLAVKLHTVLVLAGRKGEAETLARKWLAEHPRDVAMRTYLAEQALRTRDLKGAVVLYQGVLAQQPDNVAALNNMAWALGQLNDPKAMGYAERALKLAPESPLVLDTVGVLLTGQGNAAKAVEYLARAVALAPDRHDIRLNYAKALLKAGRGDEARRELTQLQSATQEFPGKSEIAGLLKQS